MDQIACVLRDITEQKRAEEALQQNLTQTARGDGRTSAGQGEAL